MPPLRASAAASAALLAAALATAPAASADRYTLSEHHDVPARYDSGIARVGSRSFFARAAGGGYLTDAALREVHRVGRLVPEGVVRASGLGRFGDPAFDRAGGGRLLLPLGCAAGAGSCASGGIAVVDPTTLGWRYWIRLRRSDVRVARWVDVSPDGRYVWTSSGRDLLAYRATDIDESNAATGSDAAAIRPVRRVRRAVPPSGAVGGAFAGGRLLLAGSNRGVPEIWAVDLRTGERSRQVRLRGTRAAVAGIDVGRGDGGTLRWLLSARGVADPTYGAGHSELLTFLPASYRISADARLEGSRLIVDARLRYGSRSRVLAGATVRGGGATATTDSGGRAQLTLPAVPDGTFTVTIAKSGLRGLSVRVRVTGTNS